MEILFSTPVLRILLLVVLFAPVLFAAGVALCRDRYRTARRLAGAFAVLHLAVTAYLVAPVAIHLTEYSRSASLSFRPMAVPGDTAASELRFQEEGQDHATNLNLFFVAKPVSWCPPPAVQFFVGLDGLNVWLVLLTSLMTYLAVAVSWGFAKERAGGYYAWLFLLQFAITGAFLSFDVILFYVFFELTLIPAFFLIGGWGVGGGKRDAARKFFLYTLLGSLFTLIGVIGVVYTNPTLNTRSQPVKPGTLPEAGTVTFNVNKLIVNVLENTTERDLVVRHWAGKVNEAKARLGDAKNRPDLENLLADAEKKQAAAEDDRRSHQNTQFWLFFALIAGFVVKVPLVPFHTWLPSAYSEAPPGVTLLLSAVMAKLGTLGLLRFVLPLCPDMCVKYGLPVFGVLGAVGIVYAAFCAFAQKDVKLMAAYSSVSHLGLLVLGLFALNVEGVGGAVLHMVNHGLTAGLLFAVVAFLYDRYGTTDMTRMGGLMGAHPGFAFFAVVIALAGVGLPGLNNFVSEMMLISALFTPWNTATVGYGLAVAAAAGIFLSAWYTFTMLRTVFFGPLKQPTAASVTPPKDVTGRKVLAFGLPALLCLALGVYPQPVLDSIRGDVNVVVQVLDLARLRANQELALRENQLIPAKKGVGSLPEAAPNAAPGPRGPGGPAARPGGPPRPAGGPPGQPGDPPRQPNR
jgi:NADH-quinone oxidoreductase subunit M